MIYINSTAFSWGSSTVISSIHKQITDTFGMFYALTVPENQLPLRYFTFFFTFFNLPFYLLL